MAATGFNLRIGSGRKKNIFEYFEGLNLNRKLEEINELTMIKFESDDYVGQGVLHGDSHFVYLSMVSSSLKSKPVQKFSSLRTNPYGDSDFIFSN